MRRQTSRNAALLFAAYSSIGVTSPAGAATGTWATVAGAEAGTLTVGIDEAAGLLATPGATGPLATGAAAGFAVAGGWAAGTCAVVPGFAVAAGGAADGAETVGAGGAVTGRAAGCGGAPAGVTVSLCRRRQISRNVVRPFSITSSLAGACERCEYAPPEAQGASDHWAQ